MNLVSLSATSKQLLVCTNLDAVFSIVPLPFNVITRIINTLLDLVLVLLVVLLCKQHCQHVSLTSAAGFLVMHSLISCPSCAKNKPPATPAAAPNAAFPQPPPLWCSDLVCWGGP